MRRGRLSLCPYQFSSDQPQQLVAHPATHH